MEDESEELAKAREEAVRWSGAIKKKSAGVMLCHRIRISEEHIVTDDDVSVDAWIDFDLYVNGELVAEGATAHVGQKGGPPSPDILEVNWPVRYAGPHLAYQRFRDVVAEYHRSLIGPKGAVFRTGNNKDVRWHGAPLASIQLHKVDLVEGGDGPW